MKETSSKIPAMMLRQKIQSIMSVLRDKHGIYEFNEKDFEIVPLNLTIPGLNPIFNGYSIVHISDIHLGQWISAKHIEGLVNLINLQKPDMIAITGDFVSYILDETICNMFKSLKNLKPKDVTVAVLGNHDHWIGAEDIRRIMEETNIIELENDIYTIKQGNAMLHIAGVDSITLEKHNLDAVLEKLPKSGPAILLAHEPDFQMKVQKQKDFVYNFQDIHMVVK